MATFEVHTAYQICRKSFKTGLNEKLCFMLPIIERKIQPRKFLWFKWNDVVEVLDVEKSRLKLYNKINELILAHPDDQIFVRERFYYPHGDDYDFSLYDWKTIWKDGRWT